MSHRVLPSYFFVYLLVIRIRRHEAGYSRPFLGLPAVALKGWLRPCKQQMPPAISGCRTGEHLRNQFKPGGLLGGSVGNYLKRVACHILGDDQEYGSFPNSKGVQVEGSGLAGASKRLHA